jgi:uncharacterized membrane protein YbhN (UPF0104 family)
MFSLKRAICYLLSIALTYFVFDYIFSKIDLIDVYALASKSDLNAMLAFLCLSLIGSYCRAWRYQILLSQSGNVANISSLFLIVLVRNLCADILPAKIGSAAYIFLVNKKLGISLTSCTTSFILAFIFDMIALAPLLIYASWGVFGTHANSVELIISISLVLVLLFSILLWRLRDILNLLIKILEKLTNSKRPITQIKTWLKQAAVELEQATKNHIYLPVLLISVLIRLCKYGSLYLLLFAFLRPLGEAISNIAPSHAFLGIFAAELAASSPISGIGGFGAYEGAWVFTFKLLGLSTYLANTTAISHHIFTQAYGYLLGLLAILLLLVIPNKSTAVDLEAHSVRHWFLRYLVLVALGTCLPIFLLSLS